MKVLFFLLGENYGIFQYDNNDPLKSKWLNNERNLEFFGFSNGVS